MDIPNFISGPPELKQRLNDIIKAVNKLSHISGDGFIKVNSTHSGVTVGLSWAKVWERLPLVTPTQLRRAYCNNDAGASTSIVCHLDDDSAAEEITVECNFIIGGGNLNTSIPYLMEGDPIAVQKVGDEWWCPWWFNGFVDCPEPV